MNGKQIIFVGGLHRSGTSLLHEILRSHPAISGFTNTGAIKDEGQKLQTVYPADLVFGGPGRFGFNKASFMDEKHFLATSENSKRLLKEWSRYWDLKKDYILEKSPPNIVRTRFLQQIFPESIFIIILRHPIAVAYATKKWLRTDIRSLIEHSLRCYERFLEDMPFLNRVYVFRYEDFVLDPRHHIHELLEWVGVELFEFQNEIQPNINDKYFSMWNSDQRSFIKKLFDGFKGLFSEFEEFNKRANVFGYRMDIPEKLLPIAWLGPHNTYKASACQEQKSS
jgi:hypothetical protein